MLEDPNTDDIIAWSPKGDTFIVYKPADFSGLVLPQFFKHSNFQSFIRQLNLYGFHKLKQAPNWNEFSHPLFKRGHKHLLRDIKRKVPATAKSKRDSSGGGSSTQNTAMSMGMGMGMSNREVKMVEMSPPPPLETETMAQGTQNDIFDRLAKLERQNELVVRENRVLWMEVLTINENQKRLAQRLQVMVNILNRLVSTRDVQLTDIEMCQFKEIANDPTLAALADTTDRNQQSRPLPDDSYRSDISDQQTQMLQQVRAEVLRRGLAPQQSTSLMGTGMNAVMGGMSSGMSGGMSAAMSSGMGSGMNSGMGNGMSNGMNSGMGSAMSAAMGASQSLPRSSSASFMRNESHGLRDQRYQPMMPQSQTMSINDDSTNGFSFSQWQDFTKSHRQDQAAQFRQIANFEKSLLAGGLDVDSSDLTEYVTPSIPL